MQLKFFRSIKYAYTRLKKSNIVNLSIATSLFDISIWYIKYVFFSSNYNTSNIFSNLYI